MSPLSAKWFNLCCALGLTPSQLSKIEHDHPGNIEACLREGLTNWLQGSYNTERHGPPTWRKLVEAVGHPAGGNNHALASDIAGKHKSRLKLSWSQ